MKKFLIILSCLFLISCSNFEEDHEIKEGIRKYLKETLHNPGSLEEINWTIRPDYAFKHKDSLDPDSPLVVDYDAMFNKEDSALTIRHVRLEYRSENGFGAIRKSEIFATHIENGHLQFKEAAYSYEAKNFSKVATSKLMEPRRLYLRNEFLRRNAGQVTIEDFWLEYPEYN